MSLTTLFRPFVCLLALPALTACSSLWPFGKKEAEPAPKATATPAAAKAAHPAPLAPADLHGTWECRFQIQMGKDQASFTYTDPFNPDGTLKAQAYLVYELPSTQQQYSFVVQGTGHWRMEGDTITLIVPEVIKQDRSTQKHPELINDKDLVPEDLSDTWTVKARQGQHLRVLTGSLADEMLCNKED